MNDIQDKRQSKPKRGWARTVGLLGMLYLVVVLVSAWAYAAGRYEVFPFKHIDGFVRELVAFYRGSEDGSRRISLKDRVRYHTLERRNTFDYSGFHLQDPAFVDDGFLLLSRFSKQHGQVIVELVELSGFKTVHTWIPPLEEILDRSYRDNTKNSPEGYRAFHPLLLDDGSVVFHSGGGPLVRLDKNNEIVWTVNKFFHHSIEQSHEGHLVVPIVLEAKRKTIAPGYRDEGVAILSMDGEILEEHSLTDLLMTNGYRGLIMGVGRFERDRFHSNDAEPITRDAGSARVGDIAVSIRHLSTVFLFRPSSGEVIWLQTGPWLSQHDVNLLPDGTFSVFGNDVYRLDEELSKEGGGRIDFRPAGDISEIYVYDPATGEMKTPYSDALTEVKMHTGVEGRSRILANGDVFIEETESDRLLRLSEDNVRWEYVNGVTETTSGRVNWCRYLSREEINTSWLQSK